MRPPTAGLTIGAVAHRARVALDTVRYYERRGLLTQSSLHRLLPLRLSR